MGKASPLYDVHIMRPDGTLADVDETGEIVIKIADGEPYGLFSTYNNDEKMTKKLSTTVITTWVIPHIWTRMDISGS